MSDIGERNLLEIKLLAERMTEDQRKEQIASCDSAMIQLLGSIRPLKKELEMLEKLFTYQAELKDACQRKVIPIKILPSMLSKKGKKRKRAKRAKLNRKLTEIEKIRNDLAAKDKLMKRLSEKILDDHEN